MLPSRTTPAKLISGANHNWFVCRRWPQALEKKNWRMCLSLHCGNEHQRWHLFLLNMRGKDRHVYVSLEYFRDILSETVRLAWQFSKTWVHGRIWSIWQLFDQIMSTRQPHQLKEFYVHHGSANTLFSIFLQTFKGPNWIWSAGSLSVFKTTWWPKWVPTHQTDSLFLFLKKRKKENFLIAHTCLAATKWHFCQVDLKLTTHFFSTASP